MIKIITYNCIKQATTKETIQATGQHKEVLNVNMWNEDGGREGLRGMSVEPKVELYRKSSREKLIIQSKRENSF